MVDTFLLTAIVVLLIWDLYQNRRVRHDAESVLCHVRFAEQRMRRTTNQTVLQMLDELRQVNDSLVD